MKGTYQARAAEWELVNAKTGTEYILVKFLLDDGTKVYWRGFLTEKAWQRTVESLKHCGWDGASFEQMLDMTEGGGMGTQDVELVLDEEEYQGQTQTKVQWVNAVGGGRMQVKGAMTGDDKRRFVAKMQARLSSMGPAKPTAPKAKKQAAADDDIPF